MRPRQSLTIKVYNMKNLRAYQNVETNRPATPRQIFAVANHFAKLQDNYGLKKVFGAIFLKYQDENQDTPITMGDISKMLEMKKVPVKWTKNIQKPKVSTKVQTPSKKVVQKTTPKTSKKVEKKSTAKPSTKASELSVEDFKKKFEALTTKVNNHDAQFVEAEKRINNLEAKLDIIASQFEAFLTTDADSMAY